jgi:multicomponent Na+:H+ antiporter subunit G
MSTWLSAILIIAGIGFFCAGTVGLLRFPDVYSRLHALTKADNLGLGLVALGLAITAESWTAALQIIFIWLLVLPASATAAHLIASAALRDGIPVWRRR